MSIIGIGAVFPQVMFIKNILRKSAINRVDSQGPVVHFGEFLKDERPLYCLHGIFPPCEHAMLAHQNTGDGVDIFIHECFDDDFAGVLLIGAFCFLLRERAGAGNGAIEIICMCGAVACDGLTGLSKDGGVAGVGVADAFERGECLV